jgi:phosphoribosyl-ATP pyrophosphohydrolase/phosphoribosyl-AMP cyclohydrolase
MAVIYENGKTLYPVIVQHAHTLQVLMFAYADDEALALTRQTGVAHFYSRSRQQLWKKGETSGHVQPVREIRTDCDQDTYLYIVDGPYPACHLNQPSCFGEAPRKTDDPLAELTAIVTQRLSQPDLSQSYTARLMSGELDALLKKIGGEAIEVIVAAASRDRAAEASHVKNSLAWETVDLLYHLAVLLVREHISLHTLSHEVQRRHQPN